MIRGSPMLQNTVGGGNRMGVGTGTTESPTAGRKQGAGRGSTGWSALTEVVKMFGLAAIPQEFSKNFYNDRKMLGGSQQSAPHLKYKRWKR